MKTNMEKIQNKSEQGFTLIELLVVIGIIAVLAGIVLIAINPARQFAQARNSQRWSDVNAILNAIGQNLADNRGTGCATIPTTATNISNSALNLACLVPNYIPALPVDPSTGTWTSSSSYDTQYEAVRDATTGRITITSPDAELSQTISVVR